jgi:hypothetical protein
MRAAGSRAWHGSRDRWELARPGRHPRRGLLAHRCHALPRILRWSFSRRAWAGARHEHARYAADDGFTIPHRAARPIVEALLTHGHLRAAYLGIARQPGALTPALSEALDGQETGLLIIGVEPEAPAAVLMGDILVRLDGHPIRDADDLMAEFSRGAAASQWTPRSFGRGDPGAPADTRRAAERRRIPPASKSQSRAPGIRGTQRARASYLANLDTLAPGGSVADERISVAVVAESPAARAGLAALFCAQGVAVVERLGPAEIAARPPDGDVVVVDGSASALPPLDTLLRWLGEWAPVVVGGTAREVGSPPRRPAALLCCTPRRTDRA